jgi:hypothetical protein
MTDANLFLVLGAILFAPHAHPLFSYCMTILLMAGWAAKFFAP